MISLCHPCGQVKDYISTPKPNLYQSLHTTVLGPDEEILDVQIRTAQMNRTADLGVLADWGAASPYQPQGSRWLSALRGISDATSGADEYIEATRMELFPDQVPLS